MAGPGIQTREVATWAKRRVLETTALGWQESHSTQICSCILRPIHIRVLVGRWNEALRQAGVRARHGIKLR